MTQFYAELPQRILEMAEGDDEFRIELTQAIYQGLQELKVKYQEGLLEHDMVKIQQIRHKIKPTLAMFDIDLLTDCLQKGKEILESEGFNADFTEHYADFSKKVDQAILEVELLLDSGKN